MTGVVSRIRGAFSGAHDLFFYVFSEGADAADADEISGVHRHPEMHDLAARIHDAGGSDIARIIS